MGFAFRLLPQCLVKPRAPAMVGQQETDQYEPHRRRQTKPELPPLRMPRPSAYPKPNTRPKISAKIADAAAHERQ